MSVFMSKKKESKIGQSYWILKYEAGKMMLRFLKDQREGNKTLIVKDFFHHFNMQLEAKVCPNTAKKNEKNKNRVNFQEPPKP